MREPIENEYFNWLCAKVLYDKSQNYYGLLLLLHKTEFLWIVSADKHRAADGIELREDFLSETDNFDDTWASQPASILEVLISFAKRAQFQTDIPVSDWFWEFLTNLKLEDFRQVYPNDIPVIDNILSIFNWRTYDQKGYGGLFPMSHTENDQRKIEIWYQFCEYLEYKGLF